MIAVTDHVDAMWSNSQEAEQTLDELQAYRRLLSLQREAIERRLDEAKAQEREARLFLGKPVRVGDLL